jgi:hypothetical protein
MVLSACILFMGVELLLAQELPEPSESAQGESEPSTLGAVAVQASEEPSRVGLTRSSTSAERETYHLTPSQERLLRAVLDDFQMADVRSIGVVLTQTGSIQKVQPRWEELVRQSRPHAASLPLLIRAVLREAYHESNREVQVYTEKVLFYNDMTESVQREIDRIEGERSLSPEREGEWDAYHKNLRAWLASIGDDAQRADDDLRSALERQAHTLESLSSISVSLHDTAMAVLR